MPAVSIDAAPVAAVSVAEAKAFLRLDGSTDDPQIASFIRSATALCESFTGRTLLSSTWRQSAPAGSALVLERAPLIALVAARAHAGLADGASIATASLELKRSASGSWSIVAPVLPPDVTHYSVDYRAGEAQVWNDIAEPLRQGILRLVAHLYTRRDSAEDGAPPAAVTALWRPYRCHRLG